MAASIIAVANQKLTPTKSFGCKGPSETILEWVSWSPPSAKTDYSVINIVTRVIDFVFTIYLYSMVNMSDKTNKMVKVSD